MRYLTQAGWDRLHEGFSIREPLRFKTETEFWEWARHQGGAFRLAAYLIVGMLGGGEWDFPGFNEIRDDAHPVRMAWSLDAIRKEMICDFLTTPGVYMAG